VKDCGGQKLGYFYFEEEPGRLSTAKMLTKDEAGRIAANVGKLPELLGKPSAKALKKAHPFDVCFCKALVSKQEHEHDEADNK
jgi:hypothetical protein